MDGETMTELNENSKQWMARYPTLTLPEMWLMVYIWKKGVGEQTAESLHKVIESYLKVRSE